MRKSIVCAVAAALAVCASAAGDIEVMGRGYWTLLSSGQYSDPAFDKALTGEWDNPELKTAAVFRDCALIGTSFYMKQREDGFASWRTVRENFFPGEDPVWDALEANVKRDKPLLLYFSGRRPRDILGRKIDADVDDYRAWKSRHPNLLGIRMACEWAKDVVKCGEKGILPGNWNVNDRHSLRRLAHVYLDRRIELNWGDAAALEALRSSTAVDHIAAEHGAVGIALETTATGGYRWNEMYMFTRGAAREIGIPWSWYEANFLNGYTKSGEWLQNSVCKYLQQYKAGVPKGGFSESLENRVWYFAYLNGANAVQPESWKKRLLAKDEKTGKIVWSPRGRKFAAFHDFTVAHPDRGVPYAPVAVLVSAAQGRNGFGQAWARCPYSHGDYAVDALFGTIVPAFRGDPKKGEEGYLLNSPYAMMFDVIAPDAKQPKADLAKALSAYKVAIVVGDYENQAEFADVLDGYAKNGGELHRITPDMLPDVGNPAMRIKDISSGRLAFPKVAALLDGLQERHFPFKVEGDVLYGANRTKDGWWLWAFNNRGVTKFADEFETVDASAAVCMRVACGEKVRPASVVELTGGKALALDDGRFAFTIPAGGFAVFHIKEESRHAPLKIMGRDYWTMLSSNRFSDPARDATLVGFWDVPEIRNLPVFRDCGLVAFANSLRQPGGDMATWPTVRENFFPGKDGDWDALEANAKPDKPLAVFFEGKRPASTLAGEIRLDYDDYAAWKARHPNLVAVRMACEWGGDALRAIQRPRIKDPERLAEVRKAWGGYRIHDRYDRLRLVSDYLDRKLALHYGDRSLMSVLRSNNCIDHVAAAKGATSITLETTNSTGVPHVEYRWSEMCAFARGAARQFQIPWCWYVAIYVNGYNRAGDWITDSVCKNMRQIYNGNPKGGISCSLERRAFYYAYLNGANAIEPEGWLNHMMQTNSAGTKVKLSARGKMFSAFHDFTAANPGRGTTYAPVAILVPFAQGRTCYGGQAWGRAPYMPGDYALDALFYTITPGSDRAKWLREGREGNLHNTKYAMMYDVLVPDSTQAKEDFARALSAYPVAILAGEYRDPSMFEDVLADYVKRGGELHRITPDMLPPLDKAAPMDIFSGRRRFPAVEAMLDGIQRRHFPFEVEGDALYGANRTKDGWWVWCFNNRGVVNYIGEDETVDPSAASRVRVRAKPGAGRIGGVTELVEGRRVPTSGDSFEAVVPAGDVRIFSL